MNKKSNYEYKQFTTISSKCSCIAQFEPEFVRIHMGFTNSK